MDQFFFGEPGRRLYGCFHAAPPEREHDAVAVLVPSIGQEAIRGHRSLRLLAERLAKSGLSCMRFDLFGSGHSEGEDRECDFDTSIASIGSAVVEARERAASERVALVGMRLGGSLAVLYGAEVQATEWQVLWAPAVDGAAYLRDLASDHERLTRRRARTRPLPGPTELLGFSFSAALVGAIRDMDLTRIATAPGRHMLLTNSLQGAAIDPLGERLMRLDVEIEERPAPRHTVWKQRGLNVTVDHEFVEFVGGWLAAATA